MLKHFHNWYHNVSTTDSGFVVVGLIIAVLGAFVGAFVYKYFDMWFSEWSSTRSKKKREQTILQLKEEVEQLRPYTKDRDKLFVNTALFAFIILALLATSPIVGSILAAAALITNLMALALALIWARTLYRLARFGEYEKEIEARIRRLSANVEPSLVNQPVNHGSLAFSDTLFTDTLTVSPLREPSKNWNITGGKWIPKENGLELVSVNPDSSPAYIWRTERLPLPAMIEFKATFTGSVWQGLRVNLFAETLDETYSNSNHIQLLIPWENGGYKMDYMNNGPLSITQTIDGMKPVVGQTYAYQLDINLERITVRVDGQIQFAADIKNNLQIRAHILRMPNAGWYWGFAAQGGLYEISDLAIVNVV